MVSAFSVQSISEDIQNHNEGILSIAVSQLTREVKSDKIMTQHFVNSKEKMDPGNDDTAPLTSQRAH